MLYIKKDSTYRWLFYNNQYTPTSGKVTIFKTIKEDNISDVKVFTTPDITHRDNYNIYEFTEVDALSEDIEQGLLHFNLGGFYTVEIFEEDVFSINPVSPVLYTERGFVDIYEQPQPCQTIVSPSNTIYSNEDILWISGMTVKTNGLYSYQDSLYLYTGTDNYISKDFLADLTAGYFEIQSAPKDYTLGFVYISKELIYSSGTLYYVINTYTSTGDLSTDVLDGNIIAISGSGGSGAYLPLAGGTMDANTTIYGQESLRIQTELSGFQSYIVQLAQGNGSDGMRMVYYDSNIGQETSINIYRGDNFILFPSIGINSTFPNFQGMVYASDYSANYTNRSLVDKGYVDNAIAGAGGVTRQTFIVTNVADLTSLTTANQGDVGIVTSTNESYILTTSDYTNLANWELILAPDSVISVNGQTGVVVLTPADILPTLTEDTILVTDGLGGFKDSNIDINSFVSQSYIDANFLSLNGGLMNVGASINFDDGTGLIYATINENGLILTDDNSGSQTSIYNNSISVTDSQYLIGLDGQNLTFFKKSILKAKMISFGDNIGANINLTLPNASGRLALTSEIIDPSGVYLPLDGGNMNTNAQVIFSDGVGSGANIDEYSYTIYDASGNQVSINSGGVNFTNTDSSQVALLQQSGVYALANVLMPITSGTLALTSQLTIGNITATGTANRVIITNGTNLSISSVLLTDLLTASSSVITTLVSDVTSLDTRLDTAESDINTLQTEVLALQQTNSYAVQVQHLTTNPVDNETRFFGDRPTAPSTSQVASQVYVDVDCEIIGAKIQLYASSTAGSNEVWDMYIRVNNTTDYLIESITVAGNQRIWSNDTLSIALNAGDFYSIKSVQPAWTTNPLSVTGGGILRFINL